MQDQPPLDLRRPALDEPAAAPAPSPAHDAGDAERRGAIRRLVACALVVGVGFTCFLVVLAIGWRGIVTIRIPTAVLLPLATTVYAAGLRLGTAIVKLPRTPFALLWLSAGAGVWAASTMNPTEFALGDLAARVMGASIPTLWLFTGRWWRERVPRAFGRR